MAKWLVERAPDSFEEVIADTLSVEYGCLVFSKRVDIDGRHQDTFAPGQRWYYRVTLSFPAGMWLTVSEAAE